MHPYYYVISLRVWHPSMPHEEMTAALGALPKHSWTVGESRLSPKGKPLGGTRQTSYWSASLTAEKVSSDNAEFEDTLHILIERFQPMTPFFARVRSEGGKSEFFVGLYSKNNIVIDLEPIQMEQLSKLSLGICLDYYPWEKE